MRSAFSALVLAIALVIPNGTSAETPPDLMVYDYTTTSAPFWTPIIKATVDEFNAVRPDSAPRLVYVAESGSLDCLDLPPSVSKRTGIIICDTFRPGDFPYDPDAPKEGWAGAARQIDDDTIEIILNSFVPEGYYLPVEQADITVCHEMMHAYTLVEDNYDSDPNSCVFGERLSPGTTDIRLMEERWPAPVVEPPRPSTVAAPSWPEQLSDAIPDVHIDLPDVNIGLPDLGIPIPGVDSGGSDELTRLCADLTPYVRTANAINGPYKATLNRTVFSGRPFAEVTPVEWDEVATATARAQAAFAAEEPPPFLAAYHAALLDATAVMTETAHVAQIEGGAAAELLWPEIKAAADRIATTITAAAAACPTLGAYE